MSIYIKIFPENFENQKINITQKKLFVPISCFSYTKPKNIEKLSKCIIFVRIFSNQKININTKKNINFGSYNYHVFLIPNQKILKNGANVISWISVVSTKFYRNILIYIAIFLRPICHIFRFG